MRANSPDDIDRLSFHLPIFKEMGDQVQMEVTPLRSYEGLATDLNKKVAGDDTTFEEVPTVPKAGLFYWITFNIEYPGKPDSYDCCGPLGKQSKLFYSNRTYHTTKKMVVSL